MAGAACVALLRGLRSLPHAVAARLLGAALPAYPILRPEQARRLSARFAASPFAPGLSLAGYYRTRLNLMLRGLRLHGRPLDQVPVRAVGEEHWRAALDGGGPVALVGLHIGLVELLHGYPQAPGRPFRILAASAFSGPLTRFLRQGRERDGKIVIMGSDPAAGLRAAARDGGILAFTADQVPGRPDAWLRLWDRIEVPWPARLFAFLARGGFRMVPVSTRLDSDGGCEFSYHAPWDPAVPVETSLRAFLEEAIAAAPDQWNWSYPKLRLIKPPPDDPNAPWRGHEAKGTDPTIRPQAISDLASQFPGSCEP